MDSAARRSCVILPTHPARAAWDWILITFVIYSALAVPLQICFTYKPNTSIEVLDIIVDTFFILDLILNFRTAYNNYDGTFELDPVKIRNKYLSTWFVIDLAASVPFDRMRGGSDETSSTSSLGLAKTPRLLRISRLLKKLDMLTSARAMRLVSVLIIFLVFTHFVGCFWWLIGRSMGENGWQFQPTIVPLILQDITWMEEDRLATVPLATAAEGSPGWLPAKYNATALLTIYQDRVPLPKMYVTAMYWALTMVMKSPWLSPSSTGEQAFCCLALFASSVMFAYFLGNVTTTIQSYDKSTAIHRDQTNLLKSLFEVRPISKVAQRSIMAYTEAMFKTRVEGVEVRNIIANMPAHLRPQVLLEVHRELITTACPWLADATLVGCTAFLQRLNPEVCLKGDFLIRAGCTSDLFYILMAGEMRVSFPSEGNRQRTVASILGLEVASHSDIIAAKGILGSQDLLAARDSRESSLVHKNAARMSRMLRQSSVNSENSSTHGGSEADHDPGGIVERPGSLLGWAPPFAKPLSSQYTARAVRFSQLTSISRAGLREVLQGPGAVDAPVWQRAVERARRMLESPDNLRSAQKRWKHGMQEASRPVANGIKGVSPSVSPDRNTPDQEEVNEEEDENTRMAGWRPTAAPAPGEAPVPKTSTNGTTSAPLRPLLGMAPALPKVEHAHESDAHASVEDSLRAEIVSVRAEMETMRKDMQHGFERLNETLRQLSGQLRTEESAAGKPTRWFDA